MSDSNKQFAKLYETEVGQILITRVGFENGYVITIQFNEITDSGVGIHSFHMMFGDSKKGEAESKEVFDRFTKTSVMMLIAQAIANAKIGITEGKMEDIDDLMAVKH